MRRLIRNFDPTDQRTAISILLLLLSLLCFLLESPSSSNPISPQFLTHIKLDHFLVQLPSLISNGLFINLWMLLANGICQSQTLNWKKNPFALNGQQSPLEETPTAASTSTRHPILQSFIIININIIINNIVIVIIITLHRSLPQFHGHTAVSFLFIRFCCNSYF